MSVANEPRSGRKGLRDLDFNVLGIWFRVYFDVGIREQDHRGRMRLSRSDQVARRSEATEPRSGRKRPRQGERGRGLKSLAGAASGRVSLLVFFPRLARPRPLSKNF